MLDVFDFIPDKGGDPNRIRESQRRRHAPESVVEEIQKLYEDAKTSETPQGIQQYALKHLRQPNIVPRS